MKYILIEVKNGDSFDKEFENKEDAVEKGQYEWEHLTEHDKKQTEAFYVLESINPDEDAENHYDGNVVKKWK